MYRTSKWWGAVAAGTLLVSSIGVGTVRSYWSTARAEFGRQVRDAVPIGFELKRLEQMTTELLPEIQANRKVAAQLDIELEYLERELETMQKTQVDAKAEMEKLRTALQEKKEPYQFGGQSFTRKQVEDDLTRRLERYEDSRSRLEAKQRIRESRRQTLAAATDKIRACQHQYGRLVEKTESLQADLKLVELASAKGNLEFDQTKLQQTRELAVSLEKRIRTLQKLADDQPHLAGEIPVEADERSAVEKFDEYFARQQPQGEGVAKQ